MTPLKNEDGSYYNPQPISMEQVAKLAGHKPITQDDNIILLSKMVGELAIVTDKLMDRVTRLEKVVDRARQFLPDLGEI